jgi:hypothetical protein
MESTHLMPETVEAIMSQPFHDQADRCMHMLTKNIEEQSSRWWYNNKNLGSRYLLFMWSQVRALWLLI